MPVLLAVVVAGFSVRVAPGPLPRTLPQPTPAAQSSAQPESPRKHVAATVHFDLLAKLLADERRSAPPNQWLAELADPDASPAVATQNHALVGQAAPDFILEDQRDQPWNLHNQTKRGPIVLVFYLGYFCNACVHDLCDLNADLERFRSLGAEVIAVSGDAPALTRERFEQYGALGFPVLSDPDHAAARSYGIFRPAQGNEAEELLHATLVIGRDGQIKWAHYGDTPFRGNKALLYEVARLENRLPESAAARVAQAAEPFAP